MSVGLTELWLPILLSAVFVFAASSIIHMLLQYHWSDWKKLPDEGRLREAIRSAGVKPGSYCIPRPASQKEMGSSETIAKYKEGPVGFVTIVPSGPPSLGKPLILWFVYTLIVGLLVAYLTGRTVSTGTDYLQVFRVAGTAAFLAYAGAEPIASIWMGRSWTATLKNVIDGLVYALVTAGTFGWLWPS